MKWRSSSTARSAEAHYNRGILHHEVNRSDAALADYDKAIELVPHFAEAHSNRGALLHARKQSDAALASYDKAIELDPNFADALLSRAAVLVALKRRDEALASLDRAIAIYDKAIELEPNYADALLSRAAVLMTLERWNDALASLDRAIALAPDSAAAHSDRGEVLYQLRQPLDAIASFDRSLALRPNAPVTLRRRAFVRMSVCDWHDLQSDIERITTEINGDLPLSVKPMLISALLDEPSSQLRAARIWMRDECPPDDTLGAIAPRPCSDKIRIGYYSADFRSHSVARLTAELFEIHD